MPNGSHVPWALAEALLAHSSCPARPTITIAACLHIVVLTVTFLSLVAVQSALFLFVEHPYDVGDALWMPPGILARVKKIDLQFTVC